MVPDVHRLLMHVCACHSAPPRSAPCSACAPFPTLCAAPRLLLQVYVAKRDGAKTLFKQYLDAQGGQLQVGAAW